jgi:DNA (cytosine-5)-methyltransferase 1
MQLSYIWNLSDLSQDKKHIKVFSCFSCGGGSTMGYKRAGFDVIGNVELDKSINSVYVKNHHPKFNFNLDLRDFNKINDLPKELFELDILDGSPPCSSFSMSGSREKLWGKEKTFREGQKKQVLDDLFFVFLDTVKKLNPKIVIAENVMGLLKGNAKGYVNEIIKRFHNLGYYVQLFHLDAAYMDVPSKRERVFFIANRMNYPQLILNFNNPPIIFGEVRSKVGIPIKKSSKQYRLLQLRTKSDHSIGDINKRLYGKCTSFNDSIVSDERICGTIASNGSYFRMIDGMKFTKDDFVCCQTFPQDYDFCGRSVQYICGMSVPPNMMAHIALEVYEQWLK